MNYNSIKITKSIEFDFNDLMKTVDFSHEFTLRDILRACVNSKISMEILGDILQCKYIKDYWNEAESRPFTGITDEREMEYLEIFWGGCRHTFEDKRCDESGWEFHGVGREGYIPKDILEYGEWEDGEKEHYRQAMAIEFSPMYELADYPIKMSAYIHITDYNSVNMDQKIDMVPSITLLDLLYCIFWELSFCGGISDREERKNELKNSIEEYNRAKEDGRLDEILVPWKEVKDNLEKYLPKVDNCNKEKENGV